MKKFIGLLFISLILLTYPVKAGYIGEGNLILSDYIIDIFINYIDGKRNKKPSKFFIVNNGQSAWYLYCSHGECRPGGDSTDIKRCERTTKGKCKVFAKGRTIKWKNGINKGNKESRFNSKWSKAEFKVKLTELGFLGNKTQKIEKKEASQTKGDGDITTQLKNLVEMYESGTITEEEFKKAKKKLLE